MAAIIKVTVVYRRRRVSKMDPSNWIVTKTKAFTVQLADGIFSRPAHDRGICRFTRNRLRPCMDRL